MTTESNKQDQRKRILWSIAMLVVIWIIIGFMFSTLTGGFFTGLSAAAAFYFGTTPDENRDLHKD